MHQIRQLHAKIRGTAKIDERFFAIEFFLRVSGARSNEIHWKRVEIFEEIQWGGEGASWMKPITEEI